jgi:hypothetical protein
LLTLLLVSQVSESTHRAVAQCRLQLLARVGVASAPAAPPPQMLVAQQQGSLAGSAEAAPASEYAPPRSACVPRIIGSLTAAAREAVGGLPPAVRNALEQALWCKAAVRLLLLPPTSDVLRKLGACRISSRKPFTEHALLGAASSSSHVQVSC